MIINKPQDEFCLLIQNDIATNATEANSKVAICSCMKNDNIIIIIIIVYLGCSLIAKAHNLQSNQRCTRTLLYSSVLYTGAAGIVWFVFWLFLAYSSPASHPRISHAERVYIETSIAEASMTSNKNEQVSN